MTLTKGLPPMCGSHERIFLSIRRIKLYELSRGLRTSRPIIHFKKKPPELSGKNAQASCAMDTPTFIVMTIVAANNALYQSKERELLLECFYYSHPLHPQHEKNNCN